MCASILCDLDIKIESSLMLRVLPSILGFRKHQLSIKILEIMAHKFADVSHHLEGRSRSEHQAIKGYDSRAI